jgi:multiple sugar transport system permease protein
MSAVSSRNRKQLKGVLGGIVVAAITIVIALPMVWMVSYSLRENTDLMESPSLIPRNPTFDNYIEMWEVAPFDIFFRNSAIVAITTVILTLALATPAGYALSRYRTRIGVGVLGTLVFMQILPGVVLLVPMYLMATRLGLYNSLQGLIIIYTGLSFSFSTLLARGFFSQVARDLEDAALVDGATRFQAFRQIALPLIRPGLLALATFIFIGAWEEFVLALTLTTRQDVRTVPIGFAYFFEQYQSNYTGLMAASIVSIIPVLMLFLLVGRGFVRGIATGGVKG